MSRPVPGGGGREGKSQNLTGDVGRKGVSGEGPPEERHRVTPSRFTHQQHRAPASDPARCSHPTSCSPQFLICPAGRPGSRKDTALSSQTHAQHPTPEPAAGHPPHAAWDGTARPHTAAPSQPRPGPHPRGDARGPCKSSHRGNAVPLGFLKRRPEVNRKDWSAGRACQAGRGIMVSALPIWRLALLPKPEDHT